MPEHITWAALIEDFEGRLIVLRDQLAPLVAGDMKLRHAGIDTGLQWVDVTEAHIQRLRDEIQSLENLVVRIRRDHA